MTFQQDLINLKNAQGLGSPGGGSSAGGEPPSRGTRAFAGCALISLLVLIGGLTIVEFGVQGVLLAALLLGMIAAVPLAASGQLKRLTRRRRSQAIWRSGRLRRDEPGEEP